jgi:hypothetical protein
MATTLKIIGAGWGRTGTTSTLGALNQLGFGPCYTFFTIMSEKPEHFARWHAAYAGKPMDWPDLFTGFNSVVDWPACDFYPELLKVWPDAKIILNVREPESWYTSMVNTIWEVYENMRRAGQTLETNPLYRFGTTMLWQGAFHGRFEDKAYAISLFEQHIARVKASLPPDKLLVFDANEGWEPLCRFLEAPVPAIPFPRVNDTKQFRERVAQNLAQGRGEAPAHEGATISGAH